MRRRLAALFLLAPLVLAACGSDSESDESAASPEDWSRQVCTEIGGWLDGIKDRSSALESEVQGVTNLEEAKGLLVKFLDDTTKQTDDLLAGIDETGHPDVDDGKQLVADLRDGIEEGRKIFADGKTRAEQIPTDSPEDFEKAATDLGTSIQDAGKRVGDQLSDLDKKYKDDRLNKAFNEDPACKKLDAA